MRFFTKSTETDFFHKKYRKESTERNFLKDFFHKKYQKGFLQRKVPKGKYQMEFFQRKVPKGKYQKGFFQRKVPKENRCHALNLVVKHALLAPLEKKLAHPELLRISDIVNAVRTACGRSKRFAAALCEAQIEFDFATLDRMVTLERASGSRWHSLLELWTRVLDLDQRGVIVAAASGCGAAFAVGLGAVGTRTSLLTPEQLALMGTVVDMLAMVRAASRLLEPERVATLTHIPVVLDELGKALEFFENASIRYPQLARLGQTPPPRLLPPVTAGMIAGAAEDPARIASSLASRLYAGVVELSVERGLVGVGSLFDPTACRTIPHAQLSGLVGIAARANCALLANTVSAVRDRVDQLHDRDDARRARPPNGGGGGGGGSRLVGAASPRGGEQDELSRYRSAITKLVTWLRFVAEFDAIRDLPLLDFWQCVRGERPWPPGFADWCEDHCVVPPHGHGKSIADASAVAWPLIAMTLCTPASSSSSQRWFSMVKHVIHGRTRLDASTFEDESVLKGFLKWGATQQACISYKDLIGSLWIIAAEQVRQQRAATAARQRQQAQRVVN
jgi:hypothetical protein